MNLTRKERRKREREASKHFSKLGTLLMSFYSFLERTPKPTDEEVRKTFIGYNTNWKTYCACHKLSDDATNLFAKEVSYSWKNRYSQKTKQE